MAIYTDTTLMLLAYAARCHLPLHLSRFLLHFARL